MRNIERRVERMEKKLNIGRQPAPNIITIFPADSKAEEALPENVKEWLTYKEQLQKCPNAKLVILYAWDELEARGLEDTTTKKPAWIRKKLQKATQSNKKAKNE